MALHRELTTPPFSADIYVPAAPVPLEDLAPALLSDPLTDRLCWAVQPISLVLGSQHVGTGALYVGSRQLSWWSASENRGFAFDYKTIIIHAISRDTQAFAHACIYLQLDAGDHEANGEDDNSSIVSEVRLVPNDPLTLQTLYDAISIGQSLHPDEDTDEPGDAFFEADDDMDYDQTRQQAVLSHMDDVFQEPTPDQLAALTLAEDEDGQYDDDDNDDEED